MNQAHQNPELRIHLQRISGDRTTEYTNQQGTKTEEGTDGQTQRPRMRRTRIPPIKVLERRERQRALNERIRDTYYDRINGNYFPMEQIEE